MHSCVGRIRYLGVLLYDADRIESAAGAGDESELPARQRDLLLDPRDPDVIQAAYEHGVPESTIEAARRSPVYRFVKEWGLALPLHAEFRTLPMLFYVPPLLPVMASLSETDHEEQAAKLDPIAKHWNDDRLYDTSGGDFFAAVEKARVPLKYMASLFGAGETEPVKAALNKLLAVRIHRRSRTVGDIEANRADRALAAAGLRPEDAERIYHLTSLARFDERFVIPPAHREQALEMLEFVGDAKGSAGFGFREKAERGA